MKKLILLTTLFSANAFAGGDLGYTRSQSSSSYTNKASAAYKFDKQNKITLSASQTKDTTGSVADDQTSQQKLAYRYKTEAGTTFTVEAKKTDDSYNFIGQGAALKSGFQVFQSDDEKDPIHTRVNLKLEAAEKKYNKSILSTPEKINVSTFSVGIDQEFTSKITGGIDVTANSFSTTSEEIKLALNGTTTMNTDFSSYAGNLSKRSVSAYLDYSEDNYSLGVSYSMDTPQLTNGTKYSSTEIYADYAFNDSFNVSVSWSRGRSEGSTTFSDTGSLGLAYHF